MSENITPKENLENENLQDMEALKKDVEKYKNDYLYLRAEFENYKRNALKERSDLLKYGGERIIRDLLDVVDNFERALQVQVNKENITTFVQGVQMTSQELKNLLVKNGVVELPSEGVVFDPTVHEALGSEPTSSVQSGYISRVHKKAYKLHEKLVRPAQVIVATAPIQPTNPNNGEQSS